ncbi:MAG: hypothetical protein ABI867_16820 [Kofleriaceae bacterium]
METPAVPAANCNFCGRSLSTDQILYTQDARIACVSCNAKVDIVAADMKVGHNIRNASIYSLVSAVIGFVFNPFLLFSISSMISAIYSITAVNKKGDERFTQHIQKDKGTIYACSIIAIVLNAIVIILVALAFAAMSATKSRYGGDY